MESDSCSGVKANVGSVDEDKQVSQANGSVT